MAVSFESPKYTANFDTLDTLRILEAVRMLGLTKTMRIYHWSTLTVFREQLSQKLVQPAVQQCRGKMDEITS